MGNSGGTYVFNDIAHIVTKLYKKFEITEAAGTIILTHVAQTLCDADWDTLDESWHEFPGNPMVEAALKAQWPEIGSEDDDVFMSQEEHRRFEARSDFPGWDAL